MFNLAQNLQIPHHLHANSFSYQLCDPGLSEIKGSKTDGKLWTNMQNTNFMTNESPLLTGKNLCLIWLWAKKLITSVSTGEYLVKSSSCLTLSNLETLKPLLGTLTGQHDCCMTWINSLSCLWWSQNPQAHGQDWWMGCRDNMFALFYCCKKPRRVSSSNSIFLRG